MKERQSLPNLSHSFNLNPEYKPTIAAIDSVVTEKQRLQKQHGLLGAIKRHHPDLYEKACKIGRFGSLHIDHLAISQYSNQEIAQKLASLEGLQLGKKTQKGLLESASKADNLIYQAALEDPNAAFLKWHSKESPFGNLSDRVIYVGTSGEITAAPHPVATNREAYSRLTEARAKEARIKLLALPLRKSERHVVNPIPSVRTESVTVVASVAEVEAKKENIAANSVAQLIKFELLETINDPFATFKETFVYPFQDISQEIGPINVINSTDAFVGQTALEVYVTAKNIIRTSVELPSKVAQKINGLMKVLRRRAVAE